MNSHMYLFHNQLRCLLNELEINILIQEAVPLDLIS